MNMGLSGLPWWTTDIGGFHGGDIRTEEFKELFVRWFEFGAFCPVFRLHGFRKPLVIAEEGKEFIPGNAKSWDYTSGAPNEVWSFGENVYEICEKYMRLREKMRPYLTEQMRKAHEKGTPVMRPLFYDYPEDGTAWEQEDEYMLGPDILAAPVTEKGRREREVYLPCGEWICLHSGEVFEGGRSVSVKADLDTIPVFVRRRELYDALK